MTNENIPNALLNFIQKILVHFHADVSVESSFSINKQCLVGNLLEDSLVTQRSIYDVVISAGSLKIPWRIPSPFLRQREDGFVSNGLVKTMLQVETNFKINTFVVGGGLPLPFPPYGRFGSGRSRWSRPCCRHFIAILPTSTPRQLACSTQHNRVLLGCRNLSPAALPTCGDVTLQTSLAAFSRPPVCLLVCQLLCAERKATYLKQPTSHTLVYTITLRFNWTPATSQSFWFSVLSHTRSLSNVRISPSSTELRSTFRTYSSPTKVILILAPSGSAVTVYSTDLGTFLTTISRNLQTTHRESLHTEPPPPPLRVMAAGGEPTEPSWMTGTSPYSLQYLRENKRFLELEKRRPNHQTVYDIFPQGIPDHIDILLSTLTEPTTPTMSTPTSSRFNTGRRK
ncbi:hypothetical protein PR048_002942 [Dryococelus australis]|uniref:Uncharacterized protein n=1 Tax=Dryococelus australis TaxID=614101 RepID=A0ABQ9INW6_9NEOP|nr:hypothetical protein PR048_002942 [Dryococelus australis]